MKLLKSHYFIAFTLTFSLLTFACSDVKKQKESKANNESNISVENPKRVNFTVDAEKLVASKSGDKVTLNLTQDLSYDILINRSEAMPNGFTSISGYIDNRETGMATLTIQDGRLFGKIDLFKENKSVMIGFDDEKKAHYFEMVNPEDLNVQQGSEPLSPPSEY